MLLSQITISRENKYTHIATLRQISQVVSLNEIYRKDEERVYHIYLF